MEFEFQFQERLVCFERLPRGASFCWALWAFLERRLQWKLSKKGKMICCKHDTLKVRCALMAIAWEVLGDSDLSRVP